MVTRPTGGTLSSSYGWRTHPITGARSFHTGSDYGHGNGTALVAPIACRVLAYGVAGGYGNRMVLEGQHQGQRITIWLNHLAVAAVEVGDPAAESEHVAVMGTTGNSTGVHLHLEIFVDGVRVDPEVWLATTAVASTTGTEIPTEEDKPMFKIIRDTNPNGGTYLVAPGGKGVVHVRNPAHLAILERVKAGTREFVFSEVQLIESYMKELAPNPSAVPLAPTLAQIKTAIAAALAAAPSVSGDAINLDELTDYLGSEFGKIAGAVQDEEDRRDRERLNS